MRGERGEEKMKWETREKRRGGGREGERRGEEKGKWERRGEKEVTIR